MVTSFDTLAGDELSGTTLDLLPFLLCGIFIGEGEVEDGIRVCCMSISISDTVGCRFGPTLECRLDDDGGGGVAIDSRRRLDGCPREPFGLPNMLVSSSGDARKIVSVRSKMVLGFSGGLSVACPPMIGDTVSQK